MQIRDTLPHAQPHQAVGFFFWSRLEQSATARQPTPPAAGGAIAVLVLVCASISTTAAVDRLGRR